jgi:UDP-N-acetylglucosamine 2-epimerase (non-hydrolysing)
LTEPFGYLDMVAAMRSAAVILTDSGGIQEEAPSLGTPVVVLRDVTERPEAVAAGAATLAGTTPERIVEAVARALESGGGERVPNPFGDGKAGERIADVVASELTGRGRRTEDWSG